MAKKTKQKVITLPCVPEFYLGRWEFAWESDPEAMSWVRFIASRRVDDHNIAVKVAIDIERYDEIASTARTKFNVPFAIADAIHQVANRIVIWHENLFNIMQIPTEIDGDPKPDMRVDWTWYQALTIRDGIRESKGAFKEIRLRRKSDIYDGVVSLDLFLPESIIETIDAGLRSARPKPDEVFQLLLAVRDREKPKALAEDMIPF